MSTYIVLALCHNEIHHIEPFTSIAEAEAKAVSLANEWHRRDGISSFGLDKITSIDEMREYYGSGAYLDSGDATNICIEEVSEIDSSCSPNVKAFPAII